MMLKLIARLPLRFEEEKGWKAEMAAMTAGDCCQMSTVASTSTLYPEKRNETTESNSYRQHKDGS